MDIQILYTGPTNEGAPLNKVTCIEGVYPVRETFKYQN